MAHAWRLEDYAYTGPGKGCRVCDAAAVANEPEPQPAGGGQAANLQPVHPLVPENKCAKTDNFLPPDGASGGAGGGRGGGGGRGADGDSGGGAIATLVGRHCELCGLQARPDLNGSSGVAIAFSATRGRYIFTIDGTQERVDIKPENLRLVGENEAGVVRLHRAQHRIYRPSSA